MADTAYDAAVLADDPSYYWPLGDTTLTNGAPIASRVGLRPGTVVTNGGILSVLGPSGAVGGALQFSGATGNYIDIGQGALIDAAGPSSVDFWARVGPGAAYGAVLSRNFGGNWPYPKLRLPNLPNQNIEIGIPFSDTIGDPQLITGQITISEAVWYHWAITRAGQQWNVYLNGQLVLTGGASASQWVADTGLPKAIGAAGTALEPFIGALTRLAVYPSTLTQGQVQSHYAAGLGPPAESAFDELLTSMLPLHYWRLDESGAGAGAVIADAVGGRNGSVAGAGISVVAGPNPAMPTALQFSGGATAYVNLGTAALFGGLEAITMGAWIRPTQAGGTPGALSVDLSNGGSYATVLMWEAGSPVWRFGSEDVRGAGVATLNEWSFVVVTRSPNGQQLYVNGLSAGPLFANNDAVTDADAGQEKYIGRTRYLSRHWVGALSRVFVFTRALTAVEIADLYANREETAIPGETVDSRDVLTRIGGSVIYPTGEADTIFQLLYRITGQLAEAGLGEPPAPGEVQSIRGSIGRMWRYDDGEFDTLASLLYAIMGVEAPNAET